MLQLSDFLQRVDKITCPLVDLQCGRILRYIVQEYVADVTLCDEQQRLVKCAFKIQVAECHPISVSIEDRFEVTLPDSHQTVGCVDRSEKRLSKRYFLRNDDVLQVLQIHLREQVILISFCTGTKVINFIIDLLKLLIEGN